MFISKDEHPQVWDRETKICDGLKAVLEQRGYTVDTSYNRLILNGVNLGFEVKGVKLTRKVKEKLRDTSNWEATFEYEAQIKKRENVLIVIIGRRCLVQENGKLSRAWYLREPKRGFELSTIADFIEKYYTQNTRALNAKLARQRLNKLVWKTLDKLNDEYGAIGLEFSSYRSDAFKRMQPSIMLPAGVTSEQLKEIASGIAYRLEVYGAIDTADTGEGPNDGGATAGASLSPSIDASLPSSA